MGLDIVLGVVVLAFAVRGWLRGFWAQSIRLSGLVASVYAAGPLRDAARPFVADHLSSIEPGVLDRLLWWGSALIAFIVMTGLATGILNLANRRRRDDGLPPQHRGDQSAGVFLGLAKGAVLAAFMLQGVSDYSKEYAEQGGWFGRQVQTSRVLPYAEQYQPARAIWKSEPVQHFVAVVREEGIGTLPTPAQLAAPTMPDSSTIAPTIRTARRPSPLQVPAAPAPAEVQDPEQALESGLREIQKELDRIARSPDSSR
jgi:Colicin V production protein